MTASPWCLNLSRDTVPGWSGRRPCTRLTDAVHWLNESLIVATVSPRDGGDQFCEP